MNQRTILRARTTYFIKRINLVQNQDSLRKSRTLVKRRRDEVKIDRVDLKWNGERRFICGDCLVDY